MSLAATQWAELTAALGTLEQQIVKRTWGRVRHLRVEQVDGRVVVHGSAPSYYVKQLILEAIRDSHPVALSGPVHMDIKVRPKVPSFG
jgi:hypothetical protein